MIAVHPAETARWDDVRAAFGTKGDPSWCFCQYFADPEWNRGKDANLRSLKRQVAQCDPPAGLIAYADDEPVDQLGRPRDDVEVAQRDGVERARIEANAAGGAWRLAGHLERASG